MANFWRRRIYSLSHRFGDVVPNESVVSAAGLPNAILFDDERPALDDHRTGERRRCVDPESTATGHHGWVEADLYALHISPKHNWTGIVSFDVGSSYRDALPPPPRGQHGGMSWLVVGTVVDEKSVWSLEPYQQPRHSESLWGVSHVISEENRASVEHFLTCVARLLNFLFRGGYAQKICVSPIDTGTAIETISIRKSLFRRAEFLNVGLCRRTRF